MSTGIDCRVLIDGVRAADGRPEEDEADPVILSALSVTWGRSNTMSQPEADTCTFSVMDQLGGQAFIAQYRTGHRVDIVAHGDAYESASVETFTNPGFETSSVTWTASNGTAKRQTTRVHSGSNALQLLPSTTSSTTVTLAPAAFQTAGTNPDAWDDIPTTADGQEWNAVASVWLPVGARVRARMVAFSGPYATAGTAIGEERITDGTGEWQTIPLRNVVQVDDAWIGIRLVLNPAGPAWNAVPTAQTWATTDPLLSWEDYGALYVDDAQVTSPAEGELGRSVLVFSGRITDMKAQWDDSTNCPVVDVTATGFTADLNNRVIGDEPWSVESVKTRAKRILNLAGLPIAIDIDTSIDDIRLSYRDIDTQGATSLLQEIATSVDGVLWPAVHMSLGAYLRLEDPSLRVALLQLEEVQVEVPGPPIVRTNLAVNPSFETQNAPWSASSGTTNAGRTSIWAHSGTYSFRVQTTASSSPTVGDVRMGSATTFPNGMVPGGTYTASAWVNTPAAHAAFSTAATSRQRRMLMFYSVDGSTFIQTFGPQGDNIAGTQRLSYTFTVPANATGLLLCVGCAGSASDNNFLSYVDDVLVEQGTTLGEFFSGATPDTATAEYAWTGTPENSTSTATTQTTTTKTVIEVVQSDPDAGLDLSACMILREPVSWVQDVSDVVTRVAASWLVQGVDDEGLPTTTDSTVHVVDTALEEQVGTRSVSVSTQLQSETDAQDVAQRILARTSPEGWRADGLTIDDEDVDNSIEGISTMLFLLDGTSRIGTPLVVGDLPPWSPTGAEAGVYLEGGSYDFIDGRWVLQLIVSSAAGLGGSAAWDELDTNWTWNMFDPSVSWNDIRGVSA